MRLMILSLVVLLAMFQYRLWIGNGSLTDLRHLNSQKQELIAENQALAERNASLAAEVMDLKQGQEAIEERARSEMGMIKQDETFYRVIEQHD